MADAWDHCHAAATLQGNVNRQAPRLYLRFVNAHGRNIDDYWLAKLSEPGQWFHGRETRQLRSLPALVRHFRSSIKGVVGAMANASFYMHFPLKERYPQRWVTHDDLRRRGLLTDDGQVNFDGRDFFIFYVGDFDACAWVYQIMPVLRASYDLGGSPAASAIESPR